MKNVVARKNQGDAGAKIILSMKLDHQDSNADNRKTLINCDKEANEQFLSKIYKSK